MQQTFAHVAELIRQARSPKELRQASNLIQYVGGVDEQNRLGKIYKVKAEEFKR